MVLNLMYGYQGRKKRKKEGVTKEKDF